MCKLGDIIVVKKYVGDGGEVINKHSFVVVSDEKDSIAGLDYDMVAAAISSFKSEEHRKRKLRCRENMELPIDAMNGKDFKKSSYVKADQAHYFKKNKIDYYVLATLKDEYMDELLKLIMKLAAAAEGKLKQITENL